MARPRKNTVQCRRLADASAARAKARRNGSVAATAISSGSESDCDIEFLAENFIENDIHENSINSVLKLKENCSTLIWNEGAGSSLRSAYTGNSIRTFFRREDEKRRRHDSV